MHACMHARTHTHIHTYIHTYIHVYTYIHTYTYIPGLDKFTTDVVALKYSCPVLNLVARDFSQILKYKNIKYVSMRVPGLVQKIVPFESFSVLSKLYI